MAHSNKPQPETYGPYQAECEAYEEMSEEDRYREEMLFEVGADRYEGFDRGDLDNPSAWYDESDCEASADYQAPVPVPAVPMCEDGDFEHIEF